LADTHPPADPLTDLAALLAAYDLASRLEIDAVYAQFSPTLDDYYDEELRLVFPAAGHDDDVGDLRPEVILTRTVPGLPAKSVRAPGAPFPLGRAMVLATAALRRGDPQARRVAQALAAGAMRLVVRQAGRTQAVELALEPGGTALLDLLR
jgi:hypothetical protein